MATLRTEGLTKSYSGRTVVRNVNLDIASGEIVGLLGPNGAGKTTTFGMVVGLTGPDSGRAMLDEHDVTTDPLYGRARQGVGDLPQGRAHGPELRAGCEGDGGPAAGAVDFPGADGRKEHPGDPRDAAAERRRA